MAAGVSREASRVGFHFVKRSPDSPQINALSDEHSSQSGNAPILVFRKSDQCGLLLPFNFDQNFHPRILEREFKASTGNFRKCNISLNHRNPPGQSVKSSSPPSRGSSLATATTAAMTNKAPKMVVAIMPR